MNATLKPTPASAADYRVAEPTQPAQVARIVRAPFAHRLDKKEVEQALHHYRRARFGMACLFHKEMGCEP